MPLLNKTIAYYIMHNNKRKPFLPIITFTSVQLLPPTKKKEKPIEQLYHQRTIPQSLLPYRTNLNLKIACMAYTSPINALALLAPVRTNAETVVNSHYKKEIQLRE